MQFNSLQFLVFFVIVVVAYFALPPRFRWPLLLIGSYYFYMCWKPEYVILIIVSTGIDYFAALGMGKHTERKPRRKYLVASLAGNLGLLFSFKYFNFFNESTRSLFDSLNIFYDMPALDVLLPVGISFYTFQTLSYAIDVYRGTRQPERHAGIFAVYVSFFPQLVAGPIERSTRLLPQFHKVQHFEWARVQSGLRLMLWGLFKKIVIADRLAIYVNEVYAAPGDFSGGPLILATYFFAFQIYCDFSGYSDIAIGAGRVMGYDLMTNFRQPYLSRSIGDFWKRWHISLSSWFRDYLYFPLGGNRVSRWRWHYNILVVFILSGLWHGANWTFVIWGALHGCYLLLSVWTARIRSNVAEFIGLDRAPRLRSVLQVFVTFHLVLLAWVFFRAESLSEAMLILSRMANIDFGNLIPELALGFHSFDVIRGWIDIVMALAAIALLEMVHFIQRRHGVDSYLKRKPVWKQWAAYYALIIGILLFGVFEHTEFIYFQF